MKNFVFPASVERDAGEYIVTFPDVPEALTGAFDRKEALELAEDALAVSLLTRAERGEPIPAPSPLREGMVPIAVPAATAAKLALMDYWKRSGLTKSEFARRLGVDEKAVRRLLDPNHNTSLSRLEKAVKILGGRLVISAMDDRSFSTELAHD